MARVDELQQKYPKIARQVIVKWEASCFGVRDSEDLDKGGVWLPDQGAYQSWDHDVSLKDMAIKHPGRLRRGIILHASPFYMKNAIGVRVKRDSQSPYQIRASGEGQLAIFEGEEKVEDVYFPKAYAGSEAGEPVAGTGMAAFRIPPSARVCGLGPIPVRHCEYFDRGEEC